jgi:hypothetical protein
MKVPAAFHQVSPKWANVIREAKTVKDLTGFRDKYGDHGYGHGFGGDIQHGANCVVGEAHMFSDAYWNECVECSNFSERFGNIMIGTLDEYGNRKQQLMQNIDDFTNHWREAHNPLIGVTPDVEPEAIKAKVQH